MSTSAIKKMESKVLYPKLSYRICGLGFTVQNTLGRFRSEKSYADAFEKLLLENNIPFQREKALNVTFIGERDRRNIPDFIVNNEIVVDFKAKLMITKEDYYQMLRYLDASNLELGIIMNFRQKYLRPKRIIRSHSYAPFDKHNNNNLCAPLAKRINNHLRH